MARRALLDTLCDLFPDLEREALLAKVLCGDVTVGDERVRDPRREVPAEADVRLAAEPRSRYVSRGGHKLEYALDQWRLPVQGRVMLDAGSSTGGFTDCLLQHGAAAVHAVDVGYNQLDFRLRRDSRVHVHERTNIMDVQTLDPAPRAAVADLSFRSIRGAASHLARLVDEGGEGEGGDLVWMVLLIKPQFEWAHPAPEFDGTVPSSQIAPILHTTLTALEAEGMILNALLESPIRGRKGNREFLLLCGYGDRRQSVGKLMQAI